MTLPSDQAESGGVEGAWLPIDSAPRDETRVLFGGCTAGPSVVIGEWGNGRYLGKKAGYERGWISGPGYRVSPTHWMPLPKPPSPQSGEPT